MMDDKGRVAAQERRDLIRYLDWRIPQLQSEGKQKPGPSPEGADIAERIERCRINAGTSKYPGVVARHKAMQEFVLGRASARQ